MYMDMVKATAMSRRGALLGGMGLGLGALGAGLGASPAKAGLSGNVKPLDLSDPKDNVYGFTKLWFGLGEPVFGGLSRRTICLDRQEPPETCLWLCRRRTYARQNSR